MIRSFIILLLAITFVSSCSKGGVTDCFFSTGDISKEVRDIGSFNTILLYDNVNLILEKSNSSALVVEAGSNLFNGIITSVNDNGVLEIRNDNNCNWIRSFESPINVYLDYVDIDSIEYHSIGDITTVNSLLTDSLWIMVYEGAGQIDMELDVGVLYCSLHYGTLDIDLSGKSKISYIYSASFGLINMIDMESDIVYVVSRSSNDIYVRATKHIGASIESIGNIYYSGNPNTISFEKTGTGELIHLPE